jgi:hypothetical protein
MENKEQNMADVGSEPYARLSALDTKVKPLILKWLSGLFGYKNYPNSFKDQWITWNIWDGVLSVSFDLRQEEQVKLLSLIHPRFLGCPQYKTLKIVNEKNFYLELKQLLHIEYPEITGSRLLIKDKHRGGTNGWYSTSDDFYTYDWEVFLSDGTSILYRNQKYTMDMVKGDFIYNATIQERGFVNFLQIFA